MKPTESSLASPDSAIRSVRPTPVFAGATPITGPRLLHAPSEVRVLPFTGFRGTMTLSESPPSRSPNEHVGVSPPLGLEFPHSLRPLSLHAVPITPADPNRCVCRWLPGQYSLPRYSGGSASTTSLSRPAQARYGLQGCSATRGGLCHKAPARPGPLPDQAACQLPDLPTTIGVGLSPTSDLRRWGAPKHPCIAKSASYSDPSSPSAPREDSLASFSQAVGGLKGFETASSAFLPPTVAARTMLSVKCSYS
jgi:hypothetical protein